VKTPAAGHPLPKGEGGWFQVTQVKNMRNFSRITRRKFIQVTTAGAAGSMVCCTNQRSPWRFFTREEGQRVEAICERLIPADQDGGAKEAGVANFIDLQLMGPYKRHRSSYRHGLEGVQQASLAMYGHGFTELGADRQDEVLKELEKGAARGEAWKNSSSKDFFTLILSHTMQGYYGDPRHGGNNGRVSWKMLGLPYPPIRGRSHYDLTKPEV
jgi:gluconate 2-dehydrogenase gamma chain